VTGKGAGKEGRERRPDREGKRGKGTENLAPRQDRLLECW